MFNKFLNDECGQGVAEYTFIMALLVVVCIMALKIFGTTLDEKFVSLKNDIANA